MLLLFLISVLIVDTTNECKYFLTVYPLYLSIMYNVRSLISSQQNYKYTHMFYLQMKTISFFIPLSQHLLSMLNDFTPINEL